MAVDYKILKCIEIDGEKMGVDTTVGTQTGASVTKAIPSSLTSYTNMTSLTLDENSLYLVQLTASFDTASSAGATWHNLRIQFGSNNVNDTRLEPTNEGNHRSVCWGFKTGENPLVLNAQAASNRNIPSATVSIYAYKLLSYVGGVIRRLLNALQTSTFRLERGCA